MSHQCKNCGAEIEYAADSQSLTCPYCGTLNEIEKPEEALPLEAELIIPLSVTQDDLEKRVYAYMAEGNYTPDDMLESVTFLKRECFYVPAYVFEVDYEAKWTASFGYDRKEPYTDYRTRNGRREAYTAYRTVTDWRPVNGEDSGTFEVAAYAGTDLTAVTLKPVDIVSYAVLNGQRTQFNMDFMQGVRSEAFSVPQKLAFSSLDDEVSDNITHRVKRHAQGDRQKDWHWTLSDSRVSSKTLYAPICYAIFDYKGTNYHYWSDGIGGETIRADELPVDWKRKRSVQLGYIPAGVAVAGLLVVLALYTDNWLSGVFAALLALGYALVRRQAILGYSKKIRQSLLTQIQASSTLTSALNEQEKEAYAKAFQRPEKPFFAKTEYDKIILPILSVIAFLGVLLPALFKSKPVPRKPAVAVATSPVTSSSPSYQRDIEQITRREKVEGMYEVKGRYGLINEISTESGDWIPYYFSMDSSAGRQIAKVCKPTKDCKIVGKVIDRERLPASINEDISPSAVFEVISVESAVPVIDQSDEENGSTTKEEDMVTEQAKSPEKGQISPGGNVSDSQSKKVLAVPQTAPKAAVSPSAKRNSARNERERKESVAKPASSTSQQPAKPKKGNIFDVLKSLPKGEQKEDDSWRN